MSKDRMPPLAAEKLDAEQRKAADAFTASRGIAPFGPFVPLLRSPEVMTRAAALGEYLRYRNSLPKRLSELAILIAARVWTQQFEWHHHRQFALEAGLEAKLIDELAEGRRPERLAADEAVVYDFAMELHRNRSVSDTTYAKALAALGEKGIIDLVGIAGYYGLLAMAMNVARTPLPAGVDPPLPVMPH
jgi:4-carboxymuconolactone decarboxylase